MTIVGAIRDRFSSLPSTESQRDASAAAAGNGALPFAGYDRLDARQVTNVLSDHSQIELEAVDSYERSHMGREAVLNKLRYMRGSEPLPRYDALSVEEILVAIEQADLETIGKVRGYERKFANRPRVLEAVALVHRSRLATGPARAVSSYQPMSARSAASRRGGQKRSGP
jgi:hypothetical protein